MYSGRYTFIYSYHVKFIILTSAIQLHRFQGTYLFAGFLYPQKAPQKIMQNLLRGSVTAYLRNAFSVPAIVLRFSSVKNVSGVALERTLLSAGAPTAWLDRGIFSSMERTIVSSSAREGVPPLFSIPT